MKTIYIVRHAKSSWATEGLEDFERPLNERGKIDAPSMGFKLAKKRILLDLILASAAFRTISTARLIAREIGYDQNKIQVKFDLYASSLNKIISIISENSNSVNNLMLIAHNPGVTQLAAFLCDNFNEEFPTCGIACLELNIDKWKNIQENCGKLIWFDFPKNAN
jgi:phosphohistidine phosphatase